MLQLQIYQFASKLWAEEHFHHFTVLLSRQASRSDREELTNFQMSGFAFDSLSLAVAQRPAARLWLQCLRQGNCSCFLNVGYRCFTLLPWHVLKSCHKVIPEESIPLGTAFSNLCNIVWGASAKTCANISCALLVSGELSSWHRCWVYAVPACTYLLVLWTDKVRCLQESSESTYIV